MVISGQSHADLKKESKGKYKMYRLRRKRAPGSLMERSPGLEEIESLKKIPMPIGIKEVVTSGQDPTLLSFQLVKHS